MLFFLSDTIEIKLKSVQNSGICFKCLFFKANYVLSFKANKQKNFTNCEDFKSEQLFTDEDDGITLHVPIA